jgi:hypothetical protein
VNPGFFSLDKRGLPLRHSVAPKFKSVVGKMPA